MECLIHGDAIGGDYLCGQWAYQNNVPIKVYAVTKLDYERFGRRAPIIRNCKMLDNENPDLLLAFPGKNGTAHMIEYALKMGVPVYDVSTEKVLKPIKWTWDFRNYLQHIKNKRQGKEQGPEPA